MTETTPHDPVMLPDVTLTAAASAREVNLRRIGIPAILVFHGQDTGDAALEVNRIVRKKYPGSDEVFIASIIDLRSFPAMFRSMVQPALDKAYHNAAGKVPPGTDPADLVVLLPDWDGSVHDAVGVRDTTAVAAVVVADSRARIIRVGQGDDAGPRALDALDGLTGT